MFYLLQLFLFFEKLKIQSFLGEVCPREDQIQRSGYDYGTFIPLQPYSSEPDLERKIRFSARGSSDAHILLSDGCGCPAYSTYCDADNCQGYEIVIGGQNNRLANCILYYYIKYWPRPLSGWGNRESVIRQEKQESYNSTKVHHFQSIFVDGFCSRIFHYLDTWYFESVQLEGFLD